jgi:hypothetical protein
MSFLKNQPAPNGLLFPTLYREWHGNSSQFSKTFDDEDTQQQDGIGQ